MRNAVWFWNKKPIKVTNLDLNQINHIKRNVLLKNIKGSNFGITNQEWIKTLDKLALEKESDSIESITNSIYSNKKRNITRSVDYVINRCLNFKYIENAKQ